MNLIVITTDELETLSKEAAHVLIRLTIDWTVKCGVSDRTILMCRDESCLRIAAERDIKIMDRSTGNMARDILSSFDGEKYQGIVLAPAIQPFRESWLLDAVEKEMIKHPSQMIVTKTVAAGSISHDDRSTANLVGIPSLMLNRIRETGKIDLSAYIPVLHNAESKFDGKYPTEQFPNEQSAMVKAAEVNLFHPPVCLPENVAIVGSSNSLIDSQVGHIIDSHEAVVRVNWVRIRGFEKDVGCRMDYHATKYFQTLKETKQLFPDAPSVAMRWMQSKDPKRWVLFAHGVTPKIEKQVAQLMDNVAFASSGLFAIFWALHNGAKHISLAGYGGKKHVPKTNYYNNQVDQFALTGWKEREDSVLERLVKDGVIHHLD